MTKYYKALTPDLKSFYDNKTKWKVGKVVKVKKPDTSGADCSEGIHLGTTIWNCFIGAKFPCRMFEAEPVGKIFYKGEDKIRCQGAKLIKEIKPRQVIKINKEIKRIKNIKWFKPRKPNKETERIVELALDAFGVKAKLEYRTLLERQDWAAAWDAARDVARDAAWGAARDAAWDVARDAAWAAARDVAFITAQDMPSIKKKYPQNPFGYLIDLWEMGYYVCGVSGGKFILYYVPLDDKKK